ncbi:MAG: HD domain-containing protein [Chloroflexi bacterium]|nr:HD domain-containing protein [Chloroflexota bacterium]
MSLTLPARHNVRLQALVAAINADAELLQLFKCANINAVDRSGMNDHGEVHVRIVANAALRLLRLLVDAQVEPSITTHYGLAAEDAEVVVVLAACLHDIGMAVHRDDHELHSLVIGYPKARQILGGIYQEPQLTIVTAEVLHAMVAHQWEIRCLTLEAGVVKVADALDMSQGRSRIPFEAGSVNIHSISAQAVEAVSIERGEERPIRIAISLRNPAGIYQIDELLKRKLRNSTLAPYVEVVARGTGDTEQHMIEVYRL